MLARCLGLFGLALLWSACASSTNARPAPGAALFRFAVIADLRMDSRADGSPAPQACSEALASLAREWSTAHPPESEAARMPAPQLALVCGNLSERGAVGDTWARTVAALDGLGPPWFAAAGERDLLRAPLVDGFDGRFGGLAYSFDRGGAHFIALCSATALDERPSFSTVQLDWLRQDLAKNADSKPVFIFLRHAPDSPEFAPTQWFELRDALDGYEIAALFCGGAGVARWRSLSGLNCIEVGSLSFVARADREDPRGHVLAQIDAGRLRVWFRPLAAEQPARLLLDEALRLRSRAPFDIVAPRAGEPSEGDALQLVVRTPGEAPRQVLVDGAARACEWRRAGADWRAKVAVADLAGGAHQLVVAGDDDGLERVDARTFLRADASVLLRWRRQFQGSLRHAPVLAGARLALATSAGEVFSLDPDSGEIFWSARSSGPVLGAPWGRDDGGVVVANSAGWVEAFDAQGTRIWRYQVGAPVWLSLVGDGECVYAADDLGRVHALELADGRRRWYSADPRGALLAAPLLRADRLWLCAADGSLQSLDARNGARLAISPLSGQATPASMAGTIEGVWVAQHETALVCLDEAGRTCASGPNAWENLAGSPDGRRLYVRETAGRLGCLDSTRATTWTSACPAGRSAPVVSKDGQRVAVQGDAGVVSVHDTSDGRCLWTWRASAGGLVLAPPLLRADGCLWVAALDGSLSALRAR